MGRKKVVENAAFDVNVYAAQTEKAIEQALENDGRIRPERREAFRLMCLSVALWEHATRMVASLPESEQVYQTCNGTWAISPWEKIRQQREKAALAALGAFGLTPASFEKLRESVSQETNDGFDEL